MRPLEICKLPLRKIRSGIRHLRATIIAKRNEYYWAYYSTPGYTRIVAFKDNPRAFVMTLFDVFVAKLTGQKVIVVFLLLRSHWEWVSGPLTALSKAGRFRFQIFASSDAAIPDEARFFSRVYSMKKNILVKGISVVPSLYADLFLTPASTTTDNAVMRAPKVMFLHSLVSIAGVYEPDTFDGYDFIFCAGSHHVEELAALYKSKGLAGKCLIPGGYPKLDDVIMRVKNAPLPAERTVIFAPTLISEKTISSSLISEAPALIEWFLRNHWRVIFRPHPINLSATDPYYPIFLGVIERFQKNRGFSLDREKDYFATYAASTMMISDLSGTAYTYAFAFERPVLFFEPHSDHDFAHGRLYENRARFGAVVSSCAQLESAVDLMMREMPSYPAKIRAYRDSVIFNVGHSAEYFAANFRSLSTHTRHPEWIYT